MSSNIDGTGEAERARRRALIDQLYSLGQTASTETALFQQVAANSYGLGITDMKALSVLLQEGSMTAGQLAKRLSLTTGAVTNVIDRLQRQDFVRRAPDPEDRRKVIVVANQEKIEAGNNVYLSMGEAFRQLHESYSTEQLEFLAQYYQASIEVNKREIAKAANQHGQS